MNILVTGASGFIGKRLVFELLKKSQNNVFAITRSDTCISGATILRGDILDRDFLENIFAEISFDVVVHLAAITAHDEIVGNKTETMEINLAGTINLLNCFNKYCNNAQFVYTSSGKVYGKTNEMPITECAYTNPTNILGKSKRITEQIIEYYAKPQNQYLICRIFNVYGEFQRRSFLLPTIIDQLSNDVIELGALRDFRDNIYIEDLVEALQLCIEKHECFDKIDVVNIGSGVPTCVSDVLDCFEKILNRSLKVQVSETRIRKDETLVEYCSYDKINRLVGWKPKYTLYEGIRKSLKAEGIAKG